MAGYAGWVRPQAAGAAAGAANAKAVPQRALPADPAAVAGRADPLVKGDGVILGGAGALVAQKQAPAVAAAAPALQLTEEERELIAHRRAGVKAKAMVGIPEQRAAVGTEADVGAGTAETSDEKAMNVRVDPATGKEAIKAKARIQDMKALEEAEQSSEEEVY